MPASNLWIGAGGGDWSVAANWSDGVPTADDDVRIDATGALTITVSSGTQVANSLTVLGDDVFRVTGGTLTLTAASAVNALVMTGGALNAGPDFTIAFTAALSGNGTLNGTVRNEGNLAIAGDPNLSGTLDNAGEITVTGRLDFTGSGRLNNLVEGVFTLANAAGGAVLSGAAAVPGFFNAGTLHHTLPITSTVAAPFTNLPAGIIEAEEGTLNFSANTNWEGGDFRISQTARVNFTTNNTVNLQGTFVGSGGGKLVFGGGTQGASEGAKVRMNGTFGFQEGMLEISGNAKFEDGTINNVGVLTIGGRPDFSGVINNSGKIIHSATIDFLPSGRINNLAGGIYEIQSTIEGTPVLGLGSPTLGYTNAGIFRNAQGQPINVNVSFDNLEGGVIEATVGTIGFNRNGVWNGAHFAISAGAEVWINGGTKTWHGTFTGSGTGKLLLNSGTQGASEGGIVAAGEGGATFNFAPGFFTFADNAILAAGGRFTNLGDLTVLGVPDLKGELDNAGTMTIAARLQFFGIAQLNNLASGTLNFALGANGIAAEGGTPGIHNFGTVRHLTAVSTNINTPFHNYDNALIETAAGTLVVHSGGAWTGAHFITAADAMIYFDGGALTWTGNYTGSGAGIVRLGGGIQGFEAGAAMTIGAAGARVEFGIGGFDFVNNASIGGTGTFTNAGTMRITEFPNLSTTLNNEGTILNAGRLELTGAGRLNNLEGATFEASLAGGNTFLTGGVTYNAGRIVVAGAGTYTITGTFHNLPTGSFQVVAGTLAMHSNGTWEGGEFLINTGALLTLNDGTKTWTGDYVGSGGGIVRLGGGSQGISAGGIVNPGATGMRLNFPEGMFEFADNARIGAGGTVFNLGYIKTTGRPDLDTNLENAGKIAANGNLSLNVTARLNNLVGGIIQGDTAGTIFSGDSSGGVFNAGKLLMTEVGTKTVSALFNNSASGTIEVTGGTLALHSGGLWEGANFLVSTGAMVTFNAGTRTWTGAFHGSGGGIVQLGGGSQGIGAGGAITIGPGGATVNFTSGAFDFNANASLSGGTLFNKGNMTADGRPNLSTTIENTGYFFTYAGIDIGATARIHNKVGGVLEINKPANGGYVVGTGLSPFLVNEGTILKTGVGTATGSSVSNTGTIRVVEGALSISSLSQLSAGTLSAGTYEVGVSATLTLPANVTTNNATVVLNGASTQLNAIRTNNGSLTLERTFTSTTAFTNNGTLELASGGVLAVTGALTFGANSETVFELGGIAAGSFGRVTATGAATLGGKASLALTNDFTPAFGTTFQVATFASRTGAFTEGEGFLFQRTRVFEPTTNPTNLTITTVAPGADLAASAVNTVGPLLPGQAVTVNYTVSNLATTDTFGTSWTDSAYLSLDDIFDPSDILIGRTVHNGSVAGLGSYNGSIAGTTPIAIDGNYRVIVITDSRGQTPDVDRANNDAASAAVPLVVPLLTPGTAVNGSIAEGQSILYRVNLPAGETRSFFANFNLPGQAEVFVRQFAVPTPGTNDGYAFSTTREDLTLLLPAGGAGAYYIELRGRAAAGAGAPFEFTADGFDFGIFNLDRTTAHNVGNVTIKVTGSEFSPLTGFDLISPTGTVLPALDVTFVNSGTAYATFNLLGVNAGLYDIRATQGDATNILNDALGIVTGGRAGELEFSLSVPRYIRPNGRTGTVTIDYYNAGDADIYAPLLLLEVEDVILKFPGQENFKLSGVQFFAINDEGPAGILSPGAGATLVLEWLPVSFQAHDTNDFNLMQVKDFTPIDWNDLSDSLRPAGLSNAGWEIVFSNMKTRLGDTFGELTAAASETLNHLSIAGGAPADLDSVLQFETMAADGFGEISERFKTGSYGLGYDGPEGFKVTQLADGRVRVGREDGFFAFEPIGAGIYRELGTSGTTLKVVAGDWVLTRSTGIEMHFDKNSGRMKTISDAAGGVTAAVYNGSNQLIRFDLPTGDTIAFSYNAQGLVSAVDGPDTRHTEYTYVNGRRATMTDATGTTTYTYVENAGSKALGALLSITPPGQGDRSFTYDANGWLKSASMPGLEVSFSHLGVGRFGYSLANGTSLTTLLDAQGRPAQQYDHTGRSVSFEYDARGALTAVTGPDSTSYDLAEFRPGTVTSTSPDGATITVVRDSAGKLLSFTDGNGNLTRCEYDSQGRPNATIYADGSRESVTYDNAGNISSYTNRRSQTTFYTVDASGTLLSVDYPTIPDQSYTYDDDARLTGITVDGQATSITYDAAGRVIGITFAGGRTLEYDYDSVGRLDRMEDQTGWVLDYSYTPEGPLDQIRDGSGTLLLDYTYDSLGQVVRKDFANGAATTFTYGNTNRITSIQHLAPGGSVLSSFSYTYDINGRISTMATLDGVTEYEYTRDGKLSSIELANGRRITYTYDAAGNRTVVNDNGALTDYTVNSLNAYTSAGGATFTYDSGGRPVTRTDGSGTTTYSYDEQDRVTALNGPDGYVQFEYNAFGQIAAVTRNNDRREYVYDPTQSGVVLAEYDGSGNLLSHYLPGMGLEAQITAGGEFRAFGFDASGNTALVTGTGGAVLNSYAYLPFGEVLARTETVVNPFEFVGQRGVLEVGNGESLVSLRLYNSGQGRFTSPDPRPQPGAHDYAYANSQPLTLIDYNGFDREQVMSALGEVNSYAAVIGSPVDIFISSIVASDEAAAALNLAKAAAAPTAEGAAGLKAAAALYKNNAAWLEATDLGKASSTLGTLTTGLDVAVLANTAYNYANGKATGLDLLHDGANVVADVLGNVPGFQALKLVPVIDVGSQLVFGAVSEAYYDPGDISIVGGERARDMLARAALLGLTLDEYLEKLRQQRNEEITPRDPNDIFGPVGFGAQEIPDGVELLTRFDGFITAGTYNYEIVFENKATATAPAQNITITHQLDADLNFGTFELGDFGFGAFQISIPEGRTAYSTRVDATATLGIFVDFSASISAGGLVTWTLQSIDPTTGDLPLDPFAGLLPPNISAPEGDGYVRFRVAPKAGLASGTNIDAQATIVFDLEQPIKTPLVTSTLDSAAPTGAITPFANATTPREVFAVRWSGTEEAGGSGFRNFDIYYTDNGGAPILWLPATTAAGARFVGETGHAYAFFALGRDNAGNIKALDPAAPDATIAVVAPTLTTVNKKFTFTDADGDFVTVTYKGPGTAQLSLLDAGGGRQQLDQIFVDGGDAKKSNLSIAVKKKDGPDADRLPDGDGLLNVGDITITGGLASFKGAAVNLSVDGFLSTGLVKNVVLRDVFRADALLADPLLGGVLTQVKIGGANLDKVSITARNLSDGFAITTPGVLSSLKAASISEGAISGAALGKLTTTAGGMNADLAFTGAVGAVNLKLGADSGNWSAASFGKIQVKTGNFEADLTTLGKVAGLTLKAGALGGDLAAASFGPISVTGGDVRGLITATASPASLGKTLSLAKLTIAGGDLLGDVHLLGGSGAVSVKASKAGLGGNVTGVSLAAAKIASLTVAKNLTDSVVLAGTDLGANGAPGGGDDTFAPGSIGKISIGSNVTGSVIAAGLSNPDGVFHNGDDTLFGATPAITSTIASLIVKGSVDAASYFAAGKFKGSPKFGTAKITLPHPQFLVA